MHKNLIISRIWSFFIYNIFFCDRSLFATENEDIYHTHWMKGQNTKKESFPRQKIGAVFVAMTVIMSELDDMNIWRMLAKWSQCMNPIFFSGKREYFYIHVENKLKIDEKPVLFPYHFCMHIIYVSLQILTCSIWKLSNVNLY